MRNTGAVRAALAAPAFVLLALSVAHGAGTPTRRSMLFLARDAVVREAGPKIALVGRGTQAAPVIVLGSDRTAGPREKAEAEQIRKASELLARYLEKVIGVKCAVVTPEEAAKVAGPRIFVGDPNGNPTGSFPELAKGDAHGFLLAARPGAHGIDLHIVGPRGISTLYGVWFFLQNYADVRLVMQGELGEVYPKRTRLEIPRGLYVLNPGPRFLMRIHSGTQALDMTAWLADTGASPRFEYHHNMARIFAPETYGRTHPEYYATIQGRRLVPTSSVASGWQPTYSEPACVQRAVAYADEQFTANPDLKSISLTVNDGAGYSELDDARARAEGKRLRECRGAPGQAALAGTVCRLPQLRPCRRAALVPARRELHAVRVDAGR